VLDQFGVFLLRQLVDESENLADAHTLRTLGEANRGILLGSSRVFGPPWGHSKSGAEWKVMEDTGKTA
jgi:hypothetical protein